MHTHSDRQHPCGASRFDHEEAALIPVPIHVDGAGSLTIDGAIGAVQAQTLTWLTNKDIQALTGQSPAAVTKGLRELRRCGAIFTPAPRFHVAVPPRHRDGSDIDPMLYIDPIMAAMDRHYYVALLSAAEIYGAVNPQPDEFHVMVTGTALRDRTVRGVRLCFHTYWLAGCTPVRMMRAGTTPFRVATPEITALDLVRYADRCGGIQAVAPVIHQLTTGVGLNLRRLTSFARDYPRTVLRRLCWILEHTGAPVDLTFLEQKAWLPTAQLSLLDPRGPREGPVHRRWYVIDNVSAY